MQIRTLRGLLACACLAILTASAAAATFTVNSLADPGVGVCDATECTLREAIASANAASGADTIVFSVSGTITLGSQLLIGADLTIDGPGPGVLAISGNNTTRVLRLFDAHNTVIRDLTIRDGNSTTSIDTQGAGVQVSGGSNVVLDNLRVIGNVASGAAGMQLSFGSVTVRNCEIADNFATIRAGLGIGGGSGNSYLVENTTISGNNAPNGNSGISVLTNAGMTVTLRNVTVAANTGSPGAAFNGSANPGSTIVESSVFADTTGANSSDAHAGPNTVVFNSIIERPSGVFNDGNNIGGVDPGLQPLAFVGASATRVHAFSTGLPRNFVDNTFGNSQCGTGLTSDQIGNVRPAGPRCDAGAFEVAAPVRLADWTFEELTVGQALAAGGRVRDTSGNGRDARAEAAADLPTTVIGRLGGTALAFQPTPDRVTFQDGFVFGDGGPPAGTDINFALSSSFTLEALVRIPNGSTQVASVISKESTQQNAGGWWLSVDNGRLEGVMRAGGNQIAVSGVRLINDGQWHHIAFVRDTTANQLRLYVDRQLDAVAADASSGNSSNNGDIQLGAFSNGTRHLDGAIDFARITLGALPPAEFVQVPLGPDLVLDIVDGVSTVLAGELVNYTVTITNGGDETAVAALVSNTLPPEIIAATWTCTALGGASCTSNGAGALNDTVDVPVGGTVTYSVAASITMNAFTEVTYQAAVATTGGQPEQAPADNQAIDVNLNERLLRDGFESPLPTFNAATGKFSADFSKLQTAGLGMHPSAIARDLDARGVTVGWIHLRRAGDTVQVRVSQKAAGDDVWTIGQWTDIDPFGPMTLTW